MSYHTAHDDILERFKAQWDILRPAVPVTYDSVDFDPPNQLPWVRITVLPGETRQASLAGVRRWRTTGVATVQVFAPKGEDNELALQLADDVVTAMRGVVTGTVTLKAPSIQRVGPDGSYYQLNVNTPFTYDVLD